MGENGQRDEVGEEGSIMIPEISLVLAVEIARETEGILYARVITDWGG